MVGRLLFPVLPFQATKRTTYKGVFYVHNLAGFTLLRNTVGMGTSPLTNL